MSATLPPLLALPAEITLQICSYLEGPEPTIIILRRTHPHFRRIIPKVNLLGALSKEDLRSHLLVADRYAGVGKRLNLFPPGHLACFKCFRVLPSGDFGYQNVTRSKRVGGSAGHARTCVACAIKNRRYPAGDQLRINHALHTIAWCGEVINLDADQRFCITCNAVLNGDLCQTRTWRTCTRCKEEVHNFGMRHSCPQMRPGEECEMSSTGVVKYHLRPFQTEWGGWASEICSKQGVQLWKEGRQMVLARES